MGGTYLFDHRYGDRGCLGYHKTPHTDTFLLFRDEIAQLDIYHSYLGKGLLHCVGFYALARREKRVAPGYRMDTNFSRGLFGLYIAL